MKQILTAMMVAGVLAIGSRADAQVITFEEVVPQQNPILSQVVCADTRGFRFLSNHFHLIGTDPVVFDVFTLNSNHIGYESGRGYPLLMERVGGDVFSLQSFDAGKFFSYQLADFPDADTLEIVGTRQDGSVVSHTVNLGLAYPAPNTPYARFVMPGTFVNLVSVVFTGRTAGGASGGVSVDNIAYQVAQPEVLPACVVVPTPSEIPVVALTSPLSGDVRGTVAVAATASDDVSVAGVQFRVDGIALGVEDVSAPYGLTWDTTTVVDGTHTVTAVVRDGVNNTSTSSVVVNVWNHTVVTGGSYYGAFDGVDDYAQAADTDALSFTALNADRPFTIEAWVNPASVTARQVLVGKWRDGIEEYNFHLSAGTFRIDLRDRTGGGMASAYTPAPASLIGGWHHVAVTYDGRGGATAVQGLTIYVDGVAAPLMRETNGSYTGMANTAAPVQVGRESSGWRHFAGGLDDIRLWSVARTVNQIQSSRLSELTGTETGLVAYWRLNEGIGSIVADDSPASHTLTLSGVAWTPGGPLGADETAPVISGVTTSSVTSSSVTVAFSTNESTSGRVLYTTAAACPCVEVPGGTTGTNHTVTLAGLTADTVYRFAVQATDGSGNVQTTTLQTVRTLAVTADTQAPVVSITQPVAGPVSGTVTVRATATDNIGIVGVLFRVDGVVLGAEDTTAPYEVPWPTAGGPAGAHVVTAEARDAANNRATATVNVTVSNAPVSSSPHYGVFDGSNDYGEAADSDALSFTSGTADRPFTVEAWVNPTSISARQVLVGKWRDGAQEYKLHLSAGTFRLDLRDATSNGMVSVYAGVSASLVGSWHHLAATYDGRGGATAAQGLTLYIDGVAVAAVRESNGTYTAMRNTATPLQLARESAGWRHFTGAIDDVRLWTVARTAAQIQATRLSELAGTETGLIGYWKFNEGSGTTVADDSPAAHTVTLLGGVTWASGGPMGPDVTAPVIANVATPSVTTTSVVVSFTTNEATTGRVVYTTAAACPCVEVVSAASGTSHSVTLNGLTADTLYRFAAQASDSAGNAQTTAFQTVRTLAVVVDTQAPTVTITQPVAGQVSGTVMVTATAADNIGVVGVQFRIDGVALGAEDTSAPFAMAWPTPGGTNGAHVVTAEARDAANNRTTATVAVTVANVPPSTSPRYGVFDGANDYGEAADADALSFTSGTIDRPFTVETWVNPGSVSARQVLVGKWRDGVEEYKLHLSAGTFRLDLRDRTNGGMVSIYTPAPASLVGNWNHLAVTYDGRGGATAAQGLAIYVNGVAAVQVMRETNGTYVSMANTAAPLQVGRESGGWRHYTGGLDDVRLWNVARTGLQIQAARLSELSGSETGLVGYWKFNEGTASTVADDSPAPHTLTLFGGVTWGTGGPLAP